MRAGIGIGIGRLGLEFEFKFGGMGLGFGTGISRQVLESFDICFGCVCVSLIGKLWLDEWMDEWMEIRRYRYRYNNVR